MALETLKGRKDIGSCDGTNQRFTVEDADGKLGTIFDRNWIVIDHKTNAIAFKIQNGPIKETGINGCQVDNLIETARLILVGLNDKSGLGCRENSLAITTLEEAELWLERRRQNRVRAQVEGTSNPIPRKQ